MKMDYSCGTSSQKIAKIYAEHFPGLLISSTFKN